MNQPTRLDTVIQHQQTFLHIVDSGTELKTVTDTTYWVHVAHNVVAGDIIRVRWSDMSRIVDLLITNKLSNTTVVLKVLTDYEIFSKEQVKARTLPKTKLPKSKEGDLFKIIANPLDSANCDIVTIAKGDVCDGCENIDLKTAIEKKAELETLSK